MTSPECHTLEAILHGGAKSVGHYEENLERDIRRLREKITEMGALAVAANRRCIQALDEKNRQLAYSVILRDQYIDELEKEIDRLCLEFIVRQQPVGRTLRFAYAMIKVNSELERVGDYTESMARHILDLASRDMGIPDDRFRQIAERAITMLSDSVQAFVTGDEAIARRTMAADAEVNQLRHDLSGALLKLQREGQLPIEALFPMMTVVNRFERVADQARTFARRHSTYRRASTSSIRERKRYGFCFWTTRTRADPKWPKR